VESLFRVRVFGDSRFPPPAIGIETVCVTVLVGLSDPSLITAPTKAPTHTTIAAPIKLGRQLFKTFDLSHDRGHPKIVRMLMVRPSVARVVDEARPWRKVFPLPWPTDMDELHPVEP
jgi:hypothetical protein